MFHLSAYARGLVKDLRANQFTIEQLDQLRFGEHAHEEIISAYREALKFHNRIAEVRDGVWCSASKLSKIEDPEIKEALKNLAIATRHPLREQLNFLDAFEAETGSGKEYRIEFEDVSDGDLFQYVIKIDFFGNIAAPTNLTEAHG